MRSAIFVMIFIPAFRAYCQFPQNSRLMEGKVTDDSAGVSIPFAHVYNESKKLGAAANADGIFRIPAEAGDTLLLSAVGYFPGIFIQNNSCYKGMTEFKLKPLTYGIGEVKITAFKDHNDFRKKFLSLQIPMTPTLKLRNEIFEESADEGTEAAEKKRLEEVYQRSSLEMLKKSFPIYSRDEKIMLHFREVLRNEEKQRVIAEKYNREVIYEVTRLSQEEITDFMGFCNFTDDDLYDATPYEVLEMIEEKYKNYRRLSK